MNSKFGEQLMEHRLSLSTLVQELLHDGRLTREDADRVSYSASL